MASLWQNDGRDGWTARALEPGDWFELGRSGEAVGRVGVAGRGAVVLTRYRDEVTGRERWVMLAGARAGARVNGQCVQTGVRALRDRDVIEANGETWFLSTERLPATEPYTATASGATCRRCGLSMESGQAAVRCPRCESWHHEMNDRRCWTSLTGCAGCGRQTSSESYVWTPALL